MNTSERGRGIIAIADVRKEHAPVEWSGGRLGRRWKRWIPQTTRWQWQVGELMDRKR